MKLIRFGAINEEKPGVLLTNGTKIDVSAFGQDYDEAFFGSNAIHKLQSWLENNQDSCPIVGDDVRLGPPLSRPSKIVCVGLNYAKHAAESGMDIPEEKEAPMKLVGKKTKKSTKKDPTKKLF